MKLYDDVIIKSTGQRGTIVDEGIGNGRHYFIVELDDTDQDEWLQTVADDEIEPV